MQFKLIFYLAAAIFGMGLLYKVSVWFLRSISNTSSDINLKTRLYAALKGLICTLLSIEIFKIFKVILLEVLFQSRILKEDFLRWLMHMLIFAGFMLLLLMHALDKQITAKIFSNYYSTLNPFMFLRDLFGLMVLTGIAIAVYRRFVLKVPRLRTTAMDIYAILIVAVIMFSGILLQGLKISSPTEFQAMAETYAGLYGEEAEALESLWVKDFGLVSGQVRAPFDEAVLELGREIHEESCAVCHSSAKWAFTGFAAAIAMRPIALQLDEAGAVVILWYFHILACFFGLAYLPFSKMFHIIATPVSLVAGAVMDKGKSHPANIATLQALGLDACTNCGTCSLNCSVIPVFMATGNKYVLPSEKMACLQKGIAKTVSPEKLKAIQDGFFLCTNCGRCTENCPAGIQLKDLWFNGCERLLRSGYPELSFFSELAFHRGVNGSEIPRDQYQNPIGMVRKLIADACDSDELKRTPIRLKYIDQKFKSSLVNSLQGETVSLCFSCTSCSMACPVVNSYDNPAKALDLLPHQVIRAAVMGLGELAYNSNMLWNCLGCYQCQEICPQSVHITEIFYELKNMAIEHVNRRTKTFLSSDRF